MAQKYLRFRRGHQINTNPNLKWCPFQNCQTAVKRPSKKGQPAECEKCKTQVCFECGHQYHGRSKCKEQFSKDPSYNQWADSVNAHYCPKCMMKVEKQSGCNAMKCIICKYSWCYKCGMKPGPFHQIACRQVENGKLNIIKAIFFSLLMLIGWIVFSPLLIVIAPCALAYIIWYELFYRKYKMIKDMKIYRYYDQQYERPKQNCLQMTLRFIGCFILSILCLLITPILVAVLCIIAWPGSLIFWIISLFQFRKVKRYLSTR